MIHRAARPAGPATGGTTRSVLGIASQLLNAATNVATAFAASALLRPDEFGLFVLAFACVTLVLATARGPIGFTLLTHLPRVTGEERTRLAGSAIGFTVLVGLVTTVGLAAVAPLVATLAWFVPWVLVALLQDACRHVVIAEGRTGAALLLDGVWAVVQAAFLLAWFGATGSITLGVIASAWGLGALGGTLAFGLMSRVRPRPPAAWWRTTRALVGWYTATALAGQAETYVVLLLVGVVLSPRDAGGLRAVQLFTFQPMMVVLAAVLALAIPVFAQMPETASAELIRARSRRVLLLVLPVVVVALAVVPARGPLMSLLLPQYLDYGDLVLPVILQSVTFALAVPALAMLRGRRRGRLVFLLQMQRLVLVVVLAVVGVAVGGIVGLATAMALGGVLSLVVTVVAAGSRREARRPVEPATDDQTDRRASR